MTDLAPALAWFESRRWAPLDFQREVWQHYLAGQIVDTKEL